MQSLLSAAMATASSLTSSPELFLESDAKRGKAFAALAKTLHDAQGAELVIEDMDEEQVFAGLDVTNTGVLDAAKAMLSKPKLAQNVSKGVVVAVEQKEEVDTNETKDEDEEEFGSDVSESEVLDENGDENGEKDVFDDPDFQHMSDSDLDDLPLFDKEDDEEEDDDEDHEDDGDGEDEDPGDKETSRQKEVEEQTESYMNKALASMRNKLDGSNDKSENKEDFLQLDAMDDFLDAQDRLEQRRIEKEERGETDERPFGDIDLFDENDDGGDEENAKYEDFFGSLNNEDNEDEAVYEALDENAFSGEAKSSFEESQERLRTKIASLEDAAMAPLQNNRDWQLTGEISAEKRPENSLLQEHLDYNTTSKKAPIITEAVSLNLEQLIKQRIKDKAWDDVERRVKPVDQSLHDYKRKLVLDEQKSKLSLAEIYEKEYLAQRDLHEEQNSKKVDTSVMLKVDEEEDSTAIKALKNEMNDLFAQLDALSHFHYMPKTRNAEIRVLDNVATVQVEEAAPVSYNDSQLLAPQEVVNAKTRAMEIEQSERSQTDKKRARRKKKLKQKKMSNNDNKEEGTPSAAKRLKKSTEEGVETGDKSIRSSSKFFAALQEQQSNKEVLKKKTRVKREQGKSGSQLKL